jgi:tetratricopeptide (TPR) repeat protein
VQYGLARATESPVCGSDLVSISRHQVDLARVALTEDTIGHWLGDIRGDVVTGWLLRSRTVLILLASYSVCVGCISVWAQGSDKNASRPQIRQLDEPGKDTQVLAPAPAPSGPPPAWSPRDIAAVENCDSSLGQVDTDAAFAGVFAGKITDSQGSADVQLKFRRDGDLLRGSYWRAGICGTVSGKVKGDQFLFAWNWAGNAGRGIASQSGEGFRGTAGFNQQVEGAGTFVFLRWKPREDLATLHRQVDQLRQAAKYVEATDVAERALTLAEGQFGLDHSSVITPLNDLARLYQDQGRHAEAEPLFQRALTIAEKVFGTDSQGIGAQLNNLAMLYRDQGRYAESEPLYQRALAINQKVLGPDHPIVGICLNNLAVLYVDEGRYAEAEPLFKRALTITENANGRDHADVAIRLTNLADLYNKLGRYSEAEPLIKRELAIAEKALDPSDPHVSAPLNDLASLYLQQGRYADAEPLFERALAIREKALGPNHPAVATELNNLALLYQLQGRAGGRRERTWTEPHGRWHRPEQPRRPI